MKIYKMSKNRLNMRKAFAITICLAGITTINFSHFTNKKALLFVYNPLSTCRKHREW